MVFNVLNDLFGGMSVFNDDAMNPGKKGRLSDLEIPTQEWMQSIETLQTMNATTEAQNQQTQLEDIINDTYNKLGAGRDACNTLIIQYRKTGIPEQSGAGAGAPANDVGMGEDMPAPMSASSPAPAPAPAGGPAPGGNAFDLGAGFDSANDLFGASAQGATTGPGGSTQNPPNPYQRQQI